MTSKTMMNLTLDEIIQNKRGQGRSRDIMRRRLTARKVALNPTKMFQRKKNISLALSNRLSRGGGGGRGGFKMRNVDTRRNGAIQNRLGVSFENQRIPVHKRLTLNGNPPEPPFRPRVLVPNRPLAMKRNLKTKNSEDSQPVRITTGAIVKGLRSDQLLLQKLNQHRNINLQAKVEKLRALQMKRSQLSVRSEQRRDASRPSAASKVALSFDRSLTVSIANEFSKRAKSSSRAKRRNQLPGSSSSSSSEDSYPVTPRPARRFTEELPSAPSLLRLGLERPPPPKPHRQVLDPQIQKEISALQGFTDPHTGGPGPGVKGFKMLPTKTRHSLNERFTLERSVVD